MAKANKPTKASKKLPPDPFTALYPNIAAWVQDGWVEIGQTDWSRSFVRAMDIGGMVWEGEESYPNPHEAPRALDAGIAEWLAENR